MSKKEDLRLMEEVKKTLQKRADYECVGLDTNGKLIRYNLLDKIKEAEEQDDSTRGK